METIRLHKGTQRAIVSVETAGQAGYVLIRVAEGEKGKALSSGNVYGPYPLSEAQAPYDQAITQLLQQGFTEVSAGYSLTDALLSPHAQKRARAAVRIGWRRDKKAVGPLLAALEHAKGDACAIVDALGLIGDAEALEAARKLAERKNLSRRRSGVEALRNLGDTEGLAWARQRSHERLPEPMQTALATIDENDDAKANVQTLMKAAQQCDARRRGLIADVLYEAGTPVTVAAARRIIAATTIVRPHTWRYVKSVFKRAMLRRDAKTFGFLAYAIEAAGKMSKGVKANVKSGFDGQKKYLPIFSRHTQAYMRRAIWRHLRDLARWEPEQYTAHAAEVLVHFSSKDAQVPKGLIGAYHHYHVLYRILYGKSPNLKLNWRNMKWKATSYHATNPSSGNRDDSFSDLWDTYPQPYLRVLSSASLPFVQQFGVEGLKRHPDILRNAKVAQLISLMKVDQPEVREITRQEIVRRLRDPNTGATLQVRLIMDPASSLKALQSILIEDLTRTKDVWTKDEQAICSYPLAVDGAVRMHIANLLVEMFNAHQAMREEYAGGYLAILQQDESTTGQHSGFAHIASQALTQELAKLLSTDELMRMIDEGSGSAKTVAGRVLGLRDDALDIIGLDRLIAMTDAETLSVRQAAQALVQSAKAQVEKDPSLLFTMCESDWDDTRDIAFAMLKSMPYQALGMDGLIGLCDSNDDDVQEFGRALVVEHFEKLNPEKVLFRLAEHPSQNMRLFALGLMHVHLRPGFVPLARIESFCRGVLFDLWPSRALKWGLIEFLTIRGLADSEQAGFVAKLFSDFLRTDTKGDFERVLSSLALLSVKYPDIESEIRVQSTQSTVNSSGVNS